MQTFTTRTKCNASSSITSCVHAAVCEGAGPTGAGEVRAAEVTKSVPSCQAFLPASPPRPARRPAASRATSAAPASAVHVKPCALCRVEYLALGALASAAFTAAPCAPRTACGRQRRKGRRNRSNHRVLHSLRAFSDEQAADICHAARRAASDGTYCVPPRHAVPFRTSIHACASSCRRRRARRRSNICKGPSQPQSCIAARFLGCEPHSHVSSARLTGHEQVIGVLVFPCIAFCPVDTRCGGAEPRKQLSLTPKVLFFCAGKSPAPRPCSCTTRCSTRTRRPSGRTATRRGRVRRKRRTRLWCAPCLPARRPAHTPRLGGTQHITSRTSPRRE